MENIIELYMQRELKKLNKEIDEKNLSKIKLTPEQSERIWKNICETLRNSFGDDFIY